MSINKVILIGNVGKDPEVRTMNNGNEVALFSLATSDSWKDKTTGERRDKTEWHRIVIYSQGLVNIVRNYVKKGTKLYISGSIQTRKWTDSAGIEKYATEIILQGYTAELQILDPRNSTASPAVNYDDEYYNSLNRATDGVGSNGSPHPEKSGDAKSSDDFLEEVIDDDIPF
ncbi:MAG: single-stranded DNA-binding protein [Rickettsiales bacterium]|jgi:single-strand DNA-binding protein|nr:single-stranded DNA-binding protein [Rickettsiales bacterium]